MCYCYYFFSGIPLNEGPKEQPDAPLDVFSAQPTPLVLHQQTQDIQSQVSTFSLPCWTNTAC